MEEPEREASAKVAQHLAVAVQVAEAVIRLRQQRLERRADSLTQAAGAARAGVTAQHTADRLVWSPALDRSWVARADLHDLGRAWGSASGWGDADPQATVAAGRVEERLTEMAPASMARFEELRSSGTDRIAAMQDVLSSVAAEVQYRSAEPRVFVADGVFVADAGAQTAAADAQARADASAYRARVFEATPDDLSTPLVDEHADGVAAAIPVRGDQAQWQADADAVNAHRTTESGEPHPADLAAEHTPRPYTTVQTTQPGKAVATTTPVAAKARVLSR